jgi:hypothetical protein
MFQFVKMPKSAKLIKKISKLDDEIKDSLKDLDAVEILFLAMALSQFHNSIADKMKNHIESVIDNEKGSNLDKRIEELLNEK